MESGSALPRNGSDVFHRHRAHSNFVYLTGCELPEYAALIDAETGGCGEGFVGGFCALRGDQVGKVVMGAAWRGRATWRRCPVQDLPRCMVCRSAETSGCETANE